MHPKDKHYQFGADGPYDDPRFCEDLEDRSPKNLPVVPERVYRSLRGRSVWSDYYNFANEVKEKNKTSIFWDEKKKKQIKISYERSYHYYSTS